MSPELVQLGQQALAAVANGVAKGAPLVKCQLLASQFYEALRLELRESSQADVADRNMLIAAAGRCRRTATVSISPDAMLSELKRAIELLHDSPLPEAPSRPARLRPTLRVIEGGLSRP
jgi:hypothetical protein